MLLSTHGAYALASCRGMTALAVRPVPRGWPWHLVVHRAELTFDARLVPAS
jgi:hypothetical protein